MVGVAEWFKAQDCGSCFSRVRIPSPTPIFGAVAQMGERTVRIGEAESSILSCSTKFYGLIAHLGERPWQVSDGTRKIVGA